MRMPPIVLRPNVPVRLSPRKLTVAAREADTPILVVPVTVAATDTVPEIPPGKLEGAV